MIFGMSKRDVDYFSGLAHKKKLLVMVKQHCFSVDVVVAVQQRMKYAINPNEICVVKIHVLARSLGTTLAGSLVFRAERAQKTSFIC